MLKKGIFSKVFGLMIIISLIAGGIILVIATIRQTSSMKESLVEENKVLAEVAAKAIETGYLDFSWPLEMLKKISDSEGILFLWIVKPDGEIFLADNPEMQSKVIDDPFLGSQKLVASDITYHSQRIKLIVHPLEIEVGKKPWNLYLGASLEPVEIAQRETIFTGIGIFILVVIFTALISFYFSKGVTQPLEQLREGAIIIGKGNLRHRIKIKTGDEIEELGKSFNQMAKNLMNTLEDVEEAKAKTEKERDTTLAIINNLVDGLLLFDKENKLSLVNPEAERLFNLKKEEITGKLIKELSNSSLKPLIELLEESKEVSRKELKIREGLILEVSTIPMVKEEESGTLVILHDITKEKRVERLKTEFVSLAAHQLRTPLSAIKWTLRILSDEELGKVNKEQKKYLNRTYQSNERMIGLIDDLLNVTKIEEGKYVYQPKLVHLEDLIQAVIDSLKPEIKRKNIELDFQKPKEKLPEVKVDMEKIKLAIKNLFNNAIIYSQKGGKVTISLKQKENNVKFSVQDSGIGIPEKQQKRIFTKFFRGANAIKKETEGSGLGLFIVKNIIEAHQGKIWFESERGKGSTFYFTLPY